VAALRERGRGGRAYNLSVWSATQLLSDYTATAERERALQSAGTVLLLRQAPPGGARPCDV
jgi:hypothetical protein